MTYAGDSKNINTNKTTKKYWLWFLAVFAAAFLVRLYFAVQVFPFEYVSDELSSISAVGLLYPLNWDEYFSLGLGYYGGGFNVLFAGFFYLFKDPLTIYRACLVVLSFLQAAGSLIAFVILKKHLRLESDLFAALIAIASGFLVTRRSLNITNESVLYFIIWVIIFLLFELTESDGRKARKRVLSIVLAAVMAYALSIHERMLVLIPLLLLAWLLYLIVYKKSIISLVFFIPTYAAGYFLARALKNAILDMNFSDAAGSVINTTVSTSGLELLGSSSYWKPYLTAVTGSFTTSALLSFGLVLCGIVLFFVFFFKAFFRKNELRAVESNTTIQNKVFLGVLFLAGGIVAIAFYQPLSWLYNLELAMEEGWGTTYYALKMITYVRYYGIMIPPLCMLVMTFLYKNENKKAVKIAGAAVMTGVLLNVIWLVNTYMYVRFSSAADEVWGAFGFGIPFSNDYGYIGYLIGSIVLFGMLILLFVLTKVKKVHILLIVICAFSIWQYCDRASNVSIEKAENRDKQYNTYALLEETGALDGLSEIYATDRPTVYQFLYYDRIVHPMLPEYDIEEGIAITPNYVQREEFLENNWKILETDLTDVDVVFVKGERIEQAFENAGYELVEYIPMICDFTKDDFTVVSGEKMDIVKWIRFPYGTYEVQLDKEYFDSKDYILQIKNTSYQRYFVKQYLSQTANGKVFFSVPKKDYLYIRITSESGAITEAPEKIRIRKISDVNTVGINHEGYTEKVVSALKKNKAESVAFLNNSDIENDFSYISELSGCDFKDYNEVELKKQNSPYILTNVDDEWMCFLDDYSIEVINKNYVLMKRRTEGAGVHFVDIKKDSKIKNRLTRGKYQFCFIPDDSYKGELEDMYYVLTWKKSGMDMSKKLSLKFEDNNLYSNYVKLDSEIISWDVNLYDSSNKKVKCKKITIRKPVSECEYRFGKMGADLAETVNKNTYNDRIYINCSGYGFNYELIKQYVKSGIKTDAVISYLIDENFKAIPDNGLVVIPRFNRTIYSFIEKGYQVINTNEDYVFLYRGESELLKNSDVSRYMDGKKLRGSYYIDNGELMRIDLSPGAYRIYIRSEQEDRILLCTGESVVREYKREDYLKDNNETVLCFNAIYDFNNLVLMDADGEDITDRIEAIERSSWIDTSTVSGDQYSIVENTISGNGKINIISSGMQVKADNVYYAEITFRGEPLSVKLASMDYAHSTRGLNIETSEYTKTDQNEYKMILTVTPVRKRDLDTIVFEAEFKGEYEITDFSMISDDQKGQMEEVEPSDSDSF